MWEYLDIINYNLLYEYADAVINNNKYIGTGLSIPNPYVETESRQDILRKNSYYLLNFIFRYIAGCKTLDECLDFIKCDEYENFSNKYFTEKLAGYIYIGTDDYFIKPDAGNISCIMEIIYKKADFMEQLKIYSSKGIITASKRNKLEKLIKVCNGLMERETKYEK